jgi:hypothetical protein
MEVLESKVIGSGDWSLVLFRRGCAADKSCDGRLGEVGGKSRGQELEDWRETGENREAARMLIGPRRETGTNGERWMKVGGEDDGNEQRN